VKAAAIYTRVSSEKQKEEQTIGSQTAVHKGYAQTEGYAVPSEWIFQDEGYSGANLVRPGLERLRDLAGEGQIETILVYSPYRLSASIRNYSDVFWENFYGQWLTQH
jgi:site-specific DNA recombinase